MQGNTFPRHPDDSNACNSQVTNELHRNSGSGWLGKVSPWFEPRRKSAGSHAGSGGGRDNGLGQGLEPIRITGCLWHSRPRLCVVLGPYARGRACHTSYSDRLRACPNYVWPVRSCTPVRATRHPDQFLAIRTFSRLVVAIRHIEGVSGSESAGIFGYIVRDEITTEVAHVSVKHHAVDSTAMRSGHDG